MVLKAHGSLQRGEGLARGDWTRWLYALGLLHVRTFQIQGCKGRQICHSRAMIEHCTWHCHVLFGRVEFGVAVVGKKMLALCQPYSPVIGLGIDKRGRGPVILCAAVVLYNVLTQVRPAKTLFRAQDGMIFAAMPGIQEMRRRQQKHCGLGGLFFALDSSFLKLADSTLR